jgi:hypothetical protein
VHARLLGGDEVRARDARIKYMLDSIKRMRGIVQYNIDLYRYRDQYYGATAGENPAWGRFATEARFCSAANAPLLLCLFDRARRPEFTEMCTIDNDDIALWCMNEFRWEIFTFNKHMLDREPEETVPRLMARSQS